MISYNGLIELGFKGEDFVLQDDSDGKGVYIKEWNSDKPKPSVSDIEAAEQAYIAEAIAKEEAREALKQSALVKLGVTEEEFKALTS